MAFYKTNTATDSAVSERKNLFASVKQGETARIRVLPALTEDGKTQHKQVLHYKMKDPNSEDGDRGITISCGKYHGDGTCLVCDVYDVLKGSDDPSEKNLTKFPDDIGAGTSVYVPALVATKSGSKWVHGDPILFRLTENAAGGLAKVNSNCEENGIALINDPELGQDVLVTNPPTAGKYTFQPTSLQISLTDIDPDIETKATPDMLKVLEVPTRSTEEIKEIMKHSLPQLDLDSIFAELGV